VTYLVVGIDRSTLAGWHSNIRADDPRAAASMAIDRAGERGVELVVAAVIGPGLDVLAAPAVHPRAAPRAA
jgi:hypothetical protein